LATYFNQVGGVDENKYKDDEIDIFWKICFQFIVKSYIEYNTYNPEKVYP
jgi:hypothetical protein